VQTAGLEGLLTFRHATGAGSIERKNCREFGR
jgi:hypothetical protein